MPSKFKAFKQEIDDALALIDKSGTLQKLKIESLPELDEVGDTKSLLDRCDRIADARSQEKPTIRIIHHLACSGGSLISKCIAAMPNVFLLSEVHPYSDLAIEQGEPKYAPSDISSLTRYADIPKQKELAGQLFKHSVDQVYEHVEKQGGILVLRDHTHSDFNTNAEIPEKSTVISLLEEDYEIRSVLTIRDPIDSYASLVKNAWVHFEPGTFDEYCRRLLLLIHRFNSDCIFKYEDFLKAPQEQMKEITQALGLNFSETFENIFDIFRVTGDSGRSSDVIGKRARIADESIITESELSPHYKQFRGRIL